MHRQSSICVAICVAVFASPVGMACGDEGQTLDSESSEQSTGDNLKTSDDSLADSVSDSVLDPSTPLGSNTLESSDKVGTDEINLEKELTDVLYPFAVGNTWKMENVNEAYTAEAGQTLTTSVNLYDSDFAGVGAYEIETENLHVPNTAMLRPDGMEVLSWLGTEWPASIKEPIEDGATWDYIADLVSFTWEYVPKLETKAGTFEGCYRRIASREESAVRTYCPGVGPVEVVIGNGFESGEAVYQLVEYSLE